MTTYVTPVGTAQWPWLSNPDTKWHELGEYKVSLILTEADAEKLERMITEMVDKKAEEEQAGKKKPKLAPLPFAPEEDDDGNETGRVIFKCKNKNRINSKTGEVWDRKPLIVDSKGHACNAEIGGGSQLRLKLELYPWHNAALGTGVSLQIKAVQVVELEPIKKKEFDDIDGFEAEDEPEVSRESEDGDLF